MRRWGFSIAAAIVTVMSLVLPFLHLHESDTYAPLGFPTQVWVRDAQASATVEGLSEAVTRFSQTHRVNIARHQAAPDNADFGRDLYVAVGAPNDGAAVWLAEGYPGFSRLSRTDVHPWADLNFEQVDPRGYYLVEASPGVGAELAQEFSRRGFTAVTSPMLGPTQHLTGLLFGGYTASAAIAVLAAIVLVGATVLLGAKAYGVGRLHGRSSIWLLRRDLVAAAPGVLVIGLALSLAATVALAFYNHLHWFGTYWFLAAVLLLASGVAAFIAYVLALWLTSRVNVIEAIKGHLPTRGTLLAAYLLRVPAALIAVASISTAVALAGPTQQAAQDLTAAREHAGDAAYIMLNGSLGEAGTEQLLFGEAVRWFERADLERRIVLSQDSSASYWHISKQNGGAEPNVSSPNVLTVNPTYLSEQTVLSAGGTRVTPDDLPSDRPTVLIPASRSSEAEEVVAQAVKDLEFSRSRSRAEAFPNPARAAISSNQQLFTYGAASGSPRAVVDDAFLVVVPPQLGVWGPEYIDMAESMVLREPGLPADIRADPSLATAVLATLPVQQKIADDAREAWTEWISGLVTAVVASAVLLAVVSTAVAVYVRAWAGRLFVRFVHGWSRLAANPVLIAAEAVVFAVVLFSGAKPWLDEQLAAPPDPSIPPAPIVDSSADPGAQLTVTVAALLLSALVAALVLRARERSIIADRAIDRM